MTLKVMGTRMRGAIAVAAVTLAVSAQSRITDDGKEIYILTAARLKGSEASFSPKVYRYRDGTYELLTELLDSGLKLGFPFGFQVAGDGSRFSVTGWFKSAEGEAIQTRIFNRDGVRIAALTNSAVSDGGRFACQWLGTSPLIFYECGPLDGNGVRFTIPPNGGGVMDLTDTGYVLTWAPGDVYSMWHAGVRQLLDFQQPVLSPVLSRDGSFILAVSGQSSLSVFRKDIATGEERTILPAAKSFPGFSRNRKWIVESSSTLTRVDGSERFVSLTPVSTELDAAATSTVYQDNLLFRTRDGDTSPIELVDVPRITFWASASLAPGLVTTASTIQANAQKPRELELSVDSSVVPVLDVNASGDYAVRFSLHLPYDVAPGNSSLHLQYPDSIFELQQPLLINASDAKFVLQECPTGCTRPTFFDRFPHPYPMILHEDLSSPVIATQPAVPGEAVYAFLTGLGAVTNPPAAGVPVPADTASELINTVSCQARYGENKQDLPIRSAGLAPGKIGVYQVSFVVPAIEWKGGISLDCRQDSSQSVASGMFLIQQPR